MAVGVLPQQPEPLVSPLPQRNEVDAVGRAEAQRTADRVLEAHVGGLKSRRQRDLLSEKLLLHIDGSGDFQWADIYYGARVAIPRVISEFRKTENLLRLVVDNAVAHHTTMPLRYLAESRPDRRAQEKALVDTLLANALVEDQDLNGLFAEVLYLAMACGFAPAHAYWRDDAMDQYQPTAPGQGAAQGIVDCWPGNPFDTVFGAAARRNAIYWASYGRVLPADLVRRAFDHVPGVRGIQGSTRIPSAAIFQRIARSWQANDLGVHGSPIVNQWRSRQGEEEILTVVCREVLPGVEPDWPDGRLQMIAVPGEADLREGRGTATRGILLADQPLPAGDFSFTNFYSHQRADDVLGKPWVEDLDQTQIDLNIAKSKLWEAVNRMMEAPIVAPGGAVSDDMMDLGGYSLMEIEPSLASWRPRVMEWPVQIVNALEKEVEGLRASIFRGGGYQAVSRGESPGSRTPYRAILALQQADSTVHGPVNQRFQRSACDFMRRCWKQFKRYADVPWLLTITGDEYAHLAEPWIDNTKVSDRPPKYKLVNAFGSSPELRAQEVLELMTLRGADGQIFLSTEDARRQYPNTTVFSSMRDPKVVARRRAQTVAAKIELFALRLRETMGIASDNVADPAVQQAGLMLFAFVEQQFPRKRDDDLGAHLSALSEITQDETADPIARLAAEQRQNLYYQWQAAMAGQGIPAQGAVTPAQSGDRPRTSDQLQRRAVQREAVAGGPAGVLATPATPPLRAAARG